MRGGGRPRRWLSLRQPLVSTHKDVAFELSWQSSNDEHRELSALADTTCQNHSPPMFTMTCWTKLGPSLTQLDGTRHVEPKMAPTCAMPTLFLADQLAQHTSLPAERADLAEIAKSWQPERVSGRKQQVVANSWIDALFFTPPSHLDQPARSMSTCNLREAFSLLRANAWGVGARPSDPRGNNCQGHSKRTCAAVNSGAGRRLVREIVDVALHSAWSERIVEQLP